MKIGFVSMPYSGHLNPMIALAHKLEVRGHDIVFFGIEDAATTVQAANLKFHAVAQKEFPLGASAGYLEKISKLRGLEILRFSTQTRQPKLCRAMLNHLPDAVTELGVQALVIDTIHVFVELVAIRLNLPYIHIWNILHIDRSGMTPPCFVSLPYEDSPDAREKYAAGVVDIGRFFSPVTDVAREYAAEHNLDIDWSKPGATVSKLAVITQTPKVFDFPKLPCPPQFHYTGPFHDPSSRSLIPFPWERVTAERMIYASLGTLVNGLAHVYRKIIAASAMIPGAQLVLSIGNHIRLEDLGKLPGNAIVVQSAPQLELLKRAHLCITHAGANTVLECLAAGVPMIAIPIGFDQPGMAARVAYHGVGEFLAEEDLTSDKLKALITTIMDDPNYKTRAVQMRDEIAATRGLERAATIIEQALEDALLSQASESDKTALQIQVERMS